MTASSGKPRPPRIDSSEVREHDIVGLAARQFLECIGLAADHRSNVLSLSNSPRALIASAALKASKVYLLTKAEKDRIQ